MIFILEILLFFICCISLAAYLSLFERKLIARIQLRRGPNNCGFCGILQPIADALKLLFKKNSLDNHSKQSIFSVLLLFSMTLMQLTLIPIPGSTFDTDYGLLLIVLCHTLIAFSEILIGLSTRSKYGIIGGNRAYLQTLGGHLPFVLSIIVLMLMSNTLNLKDIVTFQKDVIFMFKIFPIFVVFFIASLMNTSRIPFDFIEAESELIAGAYVEYGGILFAMIYLSEYLNLMFISALTATLFLGGYGDSSIPVLFVKTVLIISFIILIRAILPRYRQDQMIEISWGILSPILLIYTILVPL
ncbi:MAG: NADH-quinone oxidoreductase subunit H [Holosporales bacterium]|jgi:NADH:ubiquinone oxidoreductase subunit H|nr:NADH-quinone oxidoreductase subunit H [Holosporales bacterium]